MEIASIKEVIVVKDYILSLTFNDGLQKYVDIAPFIKEGVSAKLKDLEYFRSVKLNEGYIFWDNGFDFCPNFLYNFTPDSQIVEVYNFDKIHNEFLI